MSESKNRQELELELEAARKRVAELESVLAEGRQDASSLPAFAPELLEKTGIVFWMRDARTGAFLHMDAAAETLLGVSAAEIIADSGRITDRVHPQDLPAAWQADAFNGPHDILNEEFRYIHPDGSVRCFWARTRGEFDADGRLARTMGVLGDCTPYRFGNDTLQRVLDSIPSVIFLLDTEGRYIFVNQHYLKLFGGSRKEIIGKSPTDFFDAPIAERLLRTYREVLQAGKPLTVVESRIVDGRTQDFLITRSPVFDDDGCIMGMCGIAIEITEQKEIEKTLRETSDLLDAIMDHSSSYIVIKNTQGRFVRVNSLFAHDLGVSPQELIDKTDYDVFAPERAQFFGRIATTVLDTREPYVAETTMTVGGEPRHLLTTSFPLRSAEGAPSGVCTIFTDITDQHRAAEAVADNERRFRAIIDSMDRIAIQGYDQDRRVIFWNPYSERLYRYTREEALGNLLEDLIIPDIMRDGVIAAHNGWVNDNVPIPSGELVLRDKGGHDVEVYSSHLMYIAPDNRREMYCVDVDLTEIKRMERELIGARDAAEAANHAKSEFLANMSHEIRTPLNGIMGMLQLMASDPASSQQARYLDVALASSRNLTRLLSDILDLSRVEAGKMELTEEEFSMAEILDTLRPTYGDEAARKHIELRIAIADGIPKTMVGDPIRLRQVLMNLVGNAIKFTQQGFVGVEITGVRSASSGTFTLIASVEDTGIGIPPEQLACVFEPFSQLESAYCRKYHGAGLGLSIVRRLVQLMGGSLTMESEPGSGTTVYFSATFRIVDRQHGPLAPDDESPLAPMRLLLVEDDLVNRLTLGKLLENDGHTVLEAESGRHALDVLARDPVDLVLMDIQMPGMDGLEAARRIRRGDVPGLDSTIPIVALTAHAMVGDRETILSSGINDYLAKPVNMADLRRAMRRFQKPAA
ncbi:PAS domain-containing hybrid sensor histidine kinase/response regulator [Oceanidesulfovibrio marinus]|uniref:histidine kinase n=1 Tax=Oceanidesulfovibrio marinus TaxID=370038 RepID=A0ABX6NLE9_9BACT|nr:PAS domain-containing protein [Oceanidesulfovibrio marinus]QJT11061.1 PAS domain S-box protein [Oceanidesulfovibrio marinus]